MFNPDSCHTSRSPTLAITSTVSDYHSPSYRNSLGLVFYANKYGGTGNYYASPQNNVFQIADGDPICNTTGHVSDMIHPLCRTKSRDNYAIGAGTVTNGWVWVRWVICVSWLAFCFFKKILSSNGSESPSVALHAASPNHATPGNPQDWCCSTSEATMMISPSELTT